MKIQSLMGLLSLALLASPAPSRAADYTVTGLGSVGMTQVGSDLTLTDYGTRGRRVDFGQNTLAGINLNANLSEALSSQIQATFSGAGYNPALYLGLDWALVSYKLNPNFQARMGRLRAPIWLFSQELNVGIAYPWVTPPVEVYGLNPLRSFNGASLFARVPMGNQWLQAEISGGGGNTDFTVYGAGASASPQVIKSTVFVDNNINLDLRYSLSDQVMIRGGYARANVSSESLTTLDTAISAGSSTSSRTSLNTVSDIANAQLFSVGFRAEPGNFLILGEGVRRLTSGISLARATGAYGTLGYRVKNLLPYASYATHFDLVGSAYTHPAGTTAAPTTEKSTHTWTAGLNYHASESTVLKVDLSVRTTEFVNTAYNLSYPITRFRVDFVF